MMTAAEVEPTPGPKRTALEAAKLNGNVQGKLFVITGAYSGIGVETTKALLAEGGKVVVGGRNSKLQEDFVEQLKKDYDADRVDERIIDLGDLESVKDFAKYVSGKYESIDVLICNAGIMNTPPGVTKDGFEQQMGVNVIGHFLLAKLLADKTKRQVWVSSSGHKLDNSPRIDIDYIKNFSMDNTKGYNGWSAYQQSKLGNILMAKEFHKRYPNIETAALHPGAIFTNLDRHTNFWSMIKFFVFRVMPQLLWSGESLTIKSVEAGAATNVTVATLPTDKIVNGAYYEDCELSKESESAKNEEDAKTLFDYCDKVTKKYQ